MSMTIHNVNFTMSLVKPAKSAGGDKYEILEFADDGKERFIYVPQHISRHNGNPTARLLMAFVQEGGVAFDLVKKGKTGDDRYAPVNEDLWKGDIYLPQIYRGDKLMIAIHGSAPVPMPAPSPVIAPMPAPSPVIAPMPSPVPVIAPVAPAPVVAPMPEPETPEVVTYEFLTDTEFFKVIYIVLIACAMAYFHYEGDFTLALNSIAQYAVRV
jgi:hypothetical protein